jgi:hypothetical protein
LISSIASTDTFLSSIAVDQETNRERLELQVLSHGKVSIQERNDPNTQKFLQHIRNQQISFTSVNAVTNFLYQQLNGAIYKLPVDLRCFEASWDGEFQQNCIEVSLSKTCTKLVKSINYAYNLNPIQSNVSEMQLISVIDACLFVFNVVIEQLPNRNVSITTSGQCKPDYSIEYAGKFPLVMGEDKLKSNYKEGKYGKDPYVELLAKTPFTRWNHFFGELPFIFGYHALGDADSNYLEFGLIHPTLNEKGEHFTPLFAGDLVNMHDRERFCSILFKLIPVLIYLLKLCSRQSVGGYSWKHTVCREGFCKSLRVVMMRSIPVLEIQWSATTFEILTSKMRMIQRVFALIGSRDATNCNWLHFHPFHTRIVGVENEIGATEGYKCFMIPFGQSPNLVSGSNFKHCLRTICDEVKWCHEHNLIHNDIRWANICTLDNAYFLVDFDDAYIISNEQLCPPIEGLHPETHFKIDEVHGCETDLWAIGHLMITANEVAYTVTHSQRLLGIRIMEDVKNQVIHNIDQIIQLINDMSDN